MASKLVGVYCLVFPSGHYYYGQSVNIAHRRSVHYSQLLRGVHPNKGVQQVFNRHGLPALTVVCLSTSAQLDQAEQMFLDDSCGQPMCLNAARFAESPCRGRKVSNQERERVREQGRKSWADGTNGLLKVVGANAHLLSRPDVRALGLAARCTVEGSAKASSARKAWYADPANRQKQLDAVQACRSDPDTELRRVTALQAKHKDKDFQASRLRAVRDVCAKRVHCTSTGGEWDSAQAWVAWCKQTYGVSVSTTYLRTGKPYRGNVYSYSQETK